MSASVDNPILVADVGGTNLNLALLAPEGPRYRLLRKARYSTQEEVSLLGPLQHFLAGAPSLRPLRACFSGAGPVLDHRIHLTNAPWDIDASALERSLGVPVHLVNDFTALSCGVLQLDLEDPSQVTPLAHGDGSLGKRLAQLARLDLLILDDFGIAPIAAHERNDLLELLDDRVGTRSTLITSQLPVTAWHAWLDEPTLADAILDRIVHGSHKIALKGESMRKLTKAV